MDRYEHIQQRKRVKRRRRRTVLILILLCIAGGIGYGAYSTFDMFSSFASLSNVYSGFKREKSDLREEKVDIPTKPFTLLIMGVEDYATGGQNGRTDSLIFAAVDPTLQKVTMMSIPRDTRVTIAGKATEDKINAAHAYGGEKMTVETVEKFLNVPVDHYVKLDFQAFKQIVNAIGGITVDVPFDFTERSDENWYKEIPFTKGLQQLDGEEALAYVRMRKQDPAGDYGRTERQRQVLRAVLEQMSTPSSLFKVDDIAKVAGQYVKTDVPVTDGITLYNKFADMDAAAIETLQLEGEDARIEGLYYFVASTESQKYAHDLFWSILKQTEPPQPAASNT